MLLLAAATLTAGLIYIAASYFKYRVGFPLDDSWIHQTFARNLAQHGEWSFRAGVPSAGSTSPLWSALLALGFLFGLAPYIWAYFLGLLVMWGLSIVSEITARRLVKDYRPRFPWVGLFIIAEWHLLWAAMSGMETLLHGLIITLVLSALMMNSRRYLTLGLLTGLSVWVRPDGLTLLAPLVLAVILFEADTSSRLRGLLRVLIGFGAVFLFYIFFNLIIGGTPMPNTFYAKQAEYAAWQQLPIAYRLGELSLQLLVGPSFLLIPGVILWTVRSIRTRSWGSLLALTWSLGYMILYMLRLPMYQHGRYIMPAMPIFFLFGFLAVLDFSTSKTGTFGRYQWFVKTLWLASLTTVTFLFIVLGARSYSNDVALIEQEMVDTARWVNTNLPPDALLAVHDIGAIGYFSQQPIIDLAGLVSPEVVPFIRDEVRLSDYLNRQGVDYLIAFADFYPEMTANRDVVFVTNGAVATESDFTRMTIYRWK
ncbi:hypothetical protein MASR2M66_21050 [Chloroflexota bacterium]